MDVIVLFFFSAREEFIYAEPTGGWRGAKESSAGGS